MSNKTQYLSVVDDEHDIMCLFRDALSQIRDTNVCGFIDSTQALEHFKLNQLDYSLILSDYRMPTMDGIELLKKVKAINPSVKTVLISAFEVNEEDFEQCNCVDAFLQKPISIPDLIDAVETQIGTSH
jgi:DNA-binding NtrC family response regulator